MDWFLKPCNAIMFLYGHTTRGMVTMNLDDDLRKQWRSHIADDQSHTYSNIRLSSGSNHIHGSHLYSEIQRGEFPRVTLLGKSLRPYQRTVAQQTQCIH